MRLHRLILAALGAALAAGPALALPPVWIVRDADSEMVLFGSVHILPPGLEWKPPALQAALKSADDLWLEIPIDQASQAEASALVNSRRALPPGKTLGGLLSPAGRKNLARAEKALGLSDPQVQTLQPWMADILVSAAQAAKAGGAAEGGVEEAILSDPVHPARLMAFETVAQQAQLFAGAPQRDQIVSLEQTLRDLDKDPKGYDRLVRAWMDGDVKTLQREAVDPLKKESPSIYRRFVTDRNTAWIEQIKARLAGSGRTVVVVGAGHLLGPDGLPAQLRALGYSVEGP